MFSDTRRTARFAALWATLLVPATARAWPHEGTETHPGLIYRRFSGDIDIPGTGVSTQEIFVLYVDTRSPAVSFIVTRPGERGTTVSEFAARSGATAAINAGFFSGTFTSCGLTASAGETWTDSYHHLPSGRCSDSVGFDAARAVSFFDSYDVLNGPPPDGVVNVVTGMPTVVRDAAIVDQAAIESSDYPTHMASANPRTGVCMHEDDRTLVLIVVDGRADGRTGMRGITFGRFARSVLGCRTAVMLDGGGSSELFLAGQPGFEARPDGVVNRTSDGRERVVASHLGVIVDPSRLDPPDAGVPDADAGADADGGTASGDAGMADASASDRDGGGGRTDAGTSAIDGGAGAGSAVSGGCGCGAGRPRWGAVGVLIALTFVAPLSRRRPPFV